jgi:hypothetical protein
MAESTPETLRRLLAALAVLDARAPDPPPRTAEERAAERAAREDWQSAGSYQQVATVHLVLLTHRLNCG